MLVIIRGWGSTLGGRGDGEKGCANDGENFHEHLARTPNGATHHPRSFDEMGYPARADGEAGVVGAEGEGGRRLLRISFIVGALWRFNWENLSVAPIGHPF